MVTHSEKAVTTLTMLGTQPADWRGADIRWTKEMRDVPVTVTCPTCAGSGKVKLDEASKPLVCPVQPSTGWTFAYSELVREYRREAKHPCPTCRCMTRRGGYTHAVSTGEVTKYVPRLVWVGRPVWPDGTQFDSRFRADLSRSGWCCELCAKAITKSGRIPVWGRAGDGTPHGMWVGLDCARKFIPGIDVWVKATKNPDGDKLKDCRLE